jgi:ATP-binding cassette subfamily F protein 3
VLKAALKDFNGTLICVSHDRDFLDGLVTKVYEFGGGHVREHLGGIYDFLRAKKISTLQELEKKNPSTPNNPITQITQSSSKLDYAQQKAAAAERRKRERAIAEVEAAIADLEAQQAELETLLSDPANQTPDNFQKYESVKHRIEQKLYEWEILNDE